MGIKGFGKICVIGLSLVPLPPAIITTGTPFKSLSLCFGPK